MPRIEPAKASMAMRNSATPQAAHDLHPRTDDTRTTSMTVVFISWAPYCSRSDNIARELGGKSYMVYWHALGSNPATVWLKYLGQAVRTLRILRAERPDVVFVMVPPVLAILPVWLYTRISKTTYVIDAHTAAFLHPRWRHLQWLQNALSRAAATTIVTNEHLADRLRSAGAHVSIVRDVPVEFPSGDRFPPAEDFAVAAICSFNDDEPIAELFEAAARVPDVAFYVTGDSRQLSRDLIAQRPPNVTLTGFLSNAHYGSLLRRAAVVVTLTTRNHTMLRGAYEAVYQGTPVVVSDWPLLRTAFDEGAIHVDNTPDAIAAAISRIRSNQEQYRNDARRLRERKLGQWNQVRTGLLSRIEHASADL